MQGLSLLTTEHLSKINRPSRILERSENINSNTLPPQLTLVFDGQEELKDVVKDDDVASSNDILAILDVAANNGGNRVCWIQVLLDDSSL